MEAIFNTTTFMVLSAIIRRLICTCVIPIAMSARLRIKRFPRVVLGVLNSIIIRLFKRKAYVRNRRNFFRSFKRIIAFFTSRLSVKCHQQMIGLRNVNVRTRGARIANDGNRVFHTRCLTRRVRSHDRAVVITRRTSGERLRSTRGITLFLGFRFRTRIKRVTHIGRRVRIVTPIRNLRNVLHFVMPTLYIASCNGPSFLFSMDDHFGPFGIPTVRIHFSIGIRIMQIVFGRITSTRRRGARTRARLCGTKTRAARVHGGGIRGRIFLFVRECSVGPNDAFFEVSSFLSWGSSFN